MSGLGAQVSLWNILPQGVIQTILRKLSVCRQYIHQKRLASDVSYTLQLTESLDVVSCAKLLTSLGNKVSM
ncbi:hypothetical protein WJX82_001217 [Trebouxia sp. C0006]